MNRAQRRKLQHEQHEFVSKLPERLTSIPREQWPPFQPQPVQAWWSKQFMVQLYNEGTLEYPELRRLTVSRTKINPGGSWQERITRDELQSVKRTVGFGDWWGVEVFPRDRDTVNVANMRHLWLLPKPLFGWRREEG